MHAYLPPQLPKHLQDQPIAARTDLPLGRGLRAADARANADFTAFDGNVGEVVDSVQDVHRLLASAQTISATGIQTWATCPSSVLRGSGLARTANRAPRGRLVGRSTRTWVNGAPHPGAVFP